MSEGVGVVVRRLRVHRPDMDVPREADGRPAEGATEVPAPAGVEVAGAPVVLEEPGLVELASNFGGAVARWVVAGAPVVSEAVYRERTAACDACELWVADARLGLGKCMAPGCGCTRFKRWLATEACKHPEGSRWRR